MRGYRKHLFVAVAALLLVACAGLDRPEIGRGQPEAKKAPEEVEFYNRVALLSIREPNLYSVKVLDYDVPQPGITLPGRLVGRGLIGALAAASTASRNYQLTETVKDNGFSISRELQEDIARELQNAGYDVIFVPRPENSGSEFVDPDNYPQVDTPVDAYIDVYPEFVGYAAIKTGEAYVPTLEVAMRVVSARKHEVVYASTFRYGGPVPVEGATAKPADPRYNVRDFEELKSASVAIEGLGAGSQAIAELIAHNLR